MVLQKVGEYVTDIVVNGTNEGSFNQAEDATYDIDVSVSESWERKDFLVVWVGNDGACTRAYDVFDANGDFIENVSVSIQFGEGNAVTRSYTDRGPISLNETEFGCTDGAAITFSATQDGTLSIDSVNKQ